MRRRLQLLAAATVASTAVSCSASADDANPTFDTRPAAISTTIAPAPAPSTAAATTTIATTTTTTMATTPTTPEAAALALCTSGTTSALGQIADPTLDEASGLVASRGHREVIWAHNDGNERPGLFALGADGADLGLHPLMIDGVVDVEDIALLSGPDGDEVLLGDIGDNGASRASIRIYRFAEPDPAEPAPIADVQVLEYRYPDRAHNAEVLLVDETNRRIVIVTKEQRREDGIPADFGPTAPSFVFEGPLDVVDGNGPTELTAVGMLDTPLLETRTGADPPHPITTLGFGGVPTGGDVSIDGALVAVRTYETIWVWPRQTGVSVAEALQSDPCQARIAAEIQGEAVAFHDGTLITVSEGVNPFLFELRP